jgi:hypothetical protein
MRILSKVAGLVAVSILALDVAALSITPSSSSLLTSGNQTGVPQILAQIASEGYVLGDSNYKKDYDDGKESGDFKNYYSTTFTPDLVSGESGDASGGSIVWDGPSYISGAEYLLVKDGNSKPAWYLFDIGGWDGKETIELSNFWPGKGAISHVAIFGGGGTSVPDGGATAVLLGLGVLGLASLRRKS